MIERRAFTCVLAAAGVAAVLGGCAFGSVTTGETRNETVSLDLDDSKNTSVRIRMGSGSLHVRSGTPKLMEGTFKYNVEEWKPVVDRRTGELSLSQPSSSASFGNTVNDWDLTFTEQRPIEMKADLGAGEADLDLGKMDLTRVELNIGAGEVKMDLRGQPKHDISVEIRGGVGETVVYLPKEVGIAATATKGIGEISTEGLEQRDGVWVNPDRVGAPVTVRVDVKGGIGEIRLIR